MEDRHYIFQAPAKLNLFLHITGRRADGYHELQTVFQFITLADELTFRLRNDERIVRVNQWSDAVATEDDLIIRAARLLAEHGSARQGIEIGIDKRIPMGAGLGGGSSDAATVLHALNTIWGLGLGIDELAALGLSLGADVPVFVRGHAAWAEGTGEILTPLKLPETRYLLVVPSVHVSTAEVFQHPGLTRDSAPIRISDFLAGMACNSLEPVVRKVYPEIDACMNWLARHGEPRLTGTGAGIFMPVESISAARVIAGGAPDAWQTFIVEGKNRSPLLQQIERFHDGV
jgi:4-diphosphocytidyl-2-C-methyl-D-erythritol kinase